MQRDYVDLDLSIEADGGAYVARVVDSPAGQATHRFELPFSNVELENFILKLGHNRGATRRVHSPRLTTARQFGDSLYRAVFDGEVEISFRRSLDLALASRKGLRIRLRIDGAPVLTEIPWEYLYAEGLGRFIVMSSDTPLVRYLDLPKGAAALTVEPPLRVLVMVSSPTDLDPLDADREVELLRQATADLTAAGVLELDVVTPATLRSLQHRLRMADYHVFHFIGHGVYDEREGDGHLMLVDENGLSRGVSGLDLGVLLHDHHSLRLAVLNACEGARGSIENPFGGVAQSLIRQGLPAAVAMQFEISDEAALVFAHEFYLAIGDGYPIDAATVEARKAIFAAGNDVEWGTPVLHLRATDARVFELQRKAPEEARPSPEREEAILALTERRFAEAVPAWEELVVAAPQDEAAMLLLQRARDGAEAEGVLADDAARTQRQPAVAEGDSDEEDRKTQEQRKRDEEEQRIGDEETQRRKRRARAIRALVGALVAVVVVALVVLNLPGPGPDGDLAAVHLAGALTIDGDSSDWPSGTTYPTPHVAEGEPDPRVSSEWRLGWDDDALYLFVSVSDPDVMVRHASEPWLLYRGDGIDLIFGADPTGLGSAPLRDDDIQVSIGPDTPEADGAVAGHQLPTGSTSTTASDCPARVFGEGAAAPEIETAARPTDLGYEIEARVPWTVLGQPPDTGVVYGTILTVSDVAENGSRRGSRSSVPDRQVAKHCPGQWHTIELLP